LESNNRQLPFTIAI